MFTRWCAIAVLFGGFLLSDAVADVALANKFNCLVVVSGVGEGPVYYTYPMEFLAPNLFYPPIPEAFGGFTSLDLGPLSLWSAEFDVQNLSGTFKGIALNSLIVATGEIPSEEIGYFVVGLKEQPPQ